MPIAFTRFEFALGCNKKKKKKEELSRDVYNALKSIGTVVGVGESLLVFWTRLHVHTYNNIVFNMYVNARNCTQATLFLRDFIT